MELTTIIKIGAIILDAKGRMLAVHKRGKPENELIVPGGKVEDGETDAETLQRELMEELNASVVNFHPYGTFEGIAIYEPCKLIMRTYLVTLANTPTASGEIDRLVWLDANFAESPYQFASILGKQILPRLLHEGRLKVSESC